MKRPGVPTAPGPLLRRDSRDPRHWQASHRLIPEGAAAAAPSRPYTGIYGGRDASTSCAAAMPAPPRRFPPPSTVEEDASIERWSCAGQSSRSSFRLSAWQRARRKLSRARVIIFVRSAPSRTASGHARSSAPGSRSCRKRQRRWTSRRRAPLRHYRRRIGRALPLPPTNCRLLPQMGSREAERCRTVRGTAPGRVPRHGRDRRQAAGQNSTYVFNCVRDGQFTVIQPLGMR